jgi:hypothetical protein
MKKDWTSLTRLTEGKTITVERVSVDNEDLAIEGRFELPPLARLKADDQVFVAVFVKCHGSIKQMEKYFDVSYPTIKARLNRISEQLDFIQVETTSESSNPALEMLDRGEINVEQAIDILRKERDNE